VLKWYNDSEGLKKAERDELAAKIAAQLKAAGATYVQKVQVRNAKTSTNRWVGAQYKTFTFSDMDKICVYIDRLT
jgi:poly-D-alanine transfer protein DltD